MHSSVLRYFAEVARFGSIRKASDELHVATSAISRQIKKLEDELGAPLFDRLSDGLRLTPAGEIALKHARETLQQFEVMKSDLGDLQGKCTGRVHIGALDSLAVQFLPEFVLDFQRRHHAVDFRIRTGNYNNLFQYLAEGDIDLAVTFDLARPHDMKIISSSKMPLMAIVGRGHPLAQYEAVTLEQCSRFNLLLQLENEVISSMIASELSALNRSGRTLVASNNQMMLKPLITAGEGVAFFTPLGLVSELEAGDIVALPITGSKLNQLEVAVVVHKYRPLTHATQAAAVSIGMALKTFSERIGRVTEE